MVVIRDRESALRFARTIMSDLWLYHQEKVRQGILQDNLFELLREELSEAWSLYESRVSPDLADRKVIFNQAIVDVLIAQSRGVESPIWS
jgi:hypothetical protein